MRHAHQPLNQELAAFRAGMCLLALLGAYARG